jgi:hypothetical protein
MKLGICIPTFLFVAASLTGCATVPGAGQFGPSGPGGLHIGPRLEPELSASRVDGEAIVVVLPVDDNILKFTVENLSNQWMNVDRDSVLLATPAGTKTRLPGGAHSAYSLAPGEMHDVNVKFSMDGIEHGQRIAVLFDDAVTVGGVHVGLAPLPFDVR